MTHSFDEPPKQVKTPLQPGWFVIFVVCVSAFSTALGFLIRDIEFTNFYSKKKIYYPITQTATATPTKFATKYPQEPTPTLPTVLVEQGQSEMRKGPGLFFPTSEGSTINNLQPTIIGVVRQGKTIEEQYLPLKVKKYSESDFEYPPFIGYTVEIDSGKLNEKLSIEIDGIPMKNIYGIPQEPAIYCKDLDTSVGEEKFLETCLYNNEGSIPILFFFKLSQSLAVGPHTLKMTQYDGTEQTMKFQVDENTKLPPQSVLDGTNTEYHKGKTQEYISVHDYFLGADTCQRGYHFDKKYLAIPTVGYSNNNLLYKVSFNNPNTGQFNEVKLAFDNQLFDFFLPDGFTLSNSEAEQHSWGDPVVRPFYIPLERTVFVNGAPALPQKVPSYSNNTVDYFEIVPVDITGTIYTNYPLSWKGDPSSGCDG